MAPINSLPTVPLELSIVFDDDEMYVRLLTRGITVTEGDRTMVTGRRRVASAKAPLRMRPDFDGKGVSGVAGAVLPRGRLAAMMKNANTAALMETLCWAVLRRYAIHHGCNPRPPHSIRCRASEAIKRAWVRAGVEQSLRRRPLDFWPVGVPVPPASGILWPSGEKVAFQFDRPLMIAGTLLYRPVVETWAVKPLEELLTPIPRSL